MLIKLHYKGKEFLLNTKHIQVVKDETDFRVIVMSSLNIDGLSYKVELCDETLDEIQEKSIECVYVRDGK